MTETLEDRIEREVAYNLRTHALEQAHEALGKARAKMRHATRLVDPDGSGDTYAGMIGGVIVNDIEQIMWKIETEVRNRGKGETS